MASPKTDDIPRLDVVDGWPAPEEQDRWLGDAAAETTLLDAYRSGRMHHAWLLGGPKGIGKATLAYRFARFAFAHPDPASSEVAAAQDLSVPTDDRAFRQVARRAHPNLLALERPYRSDRKRFLTELSVDQIRRTVSFFGTTGGGEGWRIAIIDPADDMNANAANALLKVLEEPPDRALFFIICNTPGQLLPTIRSRCRMLQIRPFAEDEIKDAIDTHKPDGFDRSDMSVAATLSEGSLRQAILVLDGGGLEVYRAFVSLVSGAPDIEPAAMHDLADRVSRRGADDAYTGFIDVVQGWLDRRVNRVAEPERGEHNPALDAVPLARWAEVWEKTERAVAEAEALNLDRKQVALSILMSIAHAARM
ncbi:DNA polymerase III subunit delta' [Bauldia sp.]|uniref:DNA polymerase III subunit delta' n=1 Tax=Bauldia sp. TaxID=2575872 RepID=UPI003BAC37B2